MTIPTIALSPYEQKVVDAHAERKNEAAKKLHDIEEATAAGIPGKPDSGCVYNGMQYHGMPPPETPGAGTGPNRPQFAPQTGYVQNPNNYHRSMSNKKFGDIHYFHVILFLKKLFPKIFLNMKIILGR